ncbi:MAG: transglutaminase family protein, partial [Sphingobacteriales bacterium]
MQIKLGFSLSYDCPAPTPMLLTLSLHPSRRPDLLTPNVLSFSPHIESWDYYDSYGNVCTRVTAPPGRMTVSTEFDVHDTGLPDVVPFDATQHAIRDLPDDTLMYLMGSRYCETDRLTEIAWGLFGHTPEGWPRVQAILDFVHNHLTFDYQRADRTRTAFD